MCPDASGAASETGLGFYDPLLERGVELWVTLYHWDHPQWVENQGGWRSREIVEKFGAYVEAVADRLSDRVSHWLTLNEPQIFVGYGLIEGTHAPGLKLFRCESLQAAHHVLLAHGQAVRALTMRVREPEGNWAFCNTWFGDAAILGRYPEDTLAVFGSDGPTVRDGDMELIAEPLDFLGLNIYSGLPGLVGDDGPEVGGLDPGMRGRRLVGW